MSGLTDRRVMVVGGTGNVGRHIVAAQLEAGAAAVVVPSRSERRLEALAAWLDAGARERLVPLVGDMSDERDAARLLAEAGPMDGAVASLGGFVAAPRVVEATRADLEHALGGYVVAHFMVARALIPALAARGGGYVMINGPLAFAPLYPGAGLISIATAAQAMLAMVLMKEEAEGPVRVNEVVIYSSFGRGGEDRNQVTGEDIGRYVGYLLSSEGAAVRNRTIHLKTREALAAVA